MKSIKEKSKEWCNKHSNKGCTEQCDGFWQLKQTWGCEQHNMELAYEAGANYVLECFDSILPFVAKKGIIYGKIKETVEQLKK